jgi:hypothetical protein
MSGARDLVSFPRRTGLGTIANPRFGVSPPKLGIALIALINPTCPSFLSTTKPLACLNSGNFTLSQSALSWIAATELLDNNRKPTNGR